MERRHTDSLFDLFGDIMGPRRTHVEQTDGGYEIQVSLPGVTRDQVTIKVEYGDLVVEAEKNRFSPAFSQSWKIGKGLDPESVEAEMKDGILHLSIGKSEEAQRTVEVEIK
jgi:HSP20 family protein